MINDFLVSISRFLQHSGDTGNIFNKIKTTMIVTTTAISERMFDVEFCNWDLQ